MSGDEQMVAQRVELDSLVRVCTARWRVHATLAALVASIVRRKPAWGTRGRQHRMEHDAQYRVERAAWTPGWMEPAAMVDAREHEALRRRALSERSALYRAACRLVRAQGVRDREASGRLGIRGGRVRSHVRSERAIARRACARRALNG